MQRGCRNPVGAKMWVEKRRREKPGNKDVVVLRMVFADSWRQFPDNSHQSMNYLLL